MYSHGVATTTVRLDPEEERTLDELASIHGRSNALRVGLKLLAAESHRQTTLADLLADWDRESRPVSDDDVHAMSERYGRAP
jgi:predicted transcriptional regulator